MSARTDVDSIALEIARRFIPVDSPGAHNEGQQRAALQVAIVEAIHTAASDVCVEADVYYEIAEMIEPHVQRQATNPTGELPASVHDSVQILFQHWLKTRKQQAGEVQGDGLAMIGSNLRSILSMCKPDGQGISRTDAANVQHEARHALQLLDAALAARQPGAQKPIGRVEADAFASTGTRVYWNQVTPPVGTQLYAAPTQPEGYVLVPVEVRQLYDFMATTFTPFTGQQRQINIQLGLARKAMLAAKAVQP